MNPNSGVIRTPDHRLRVFVSSTLRELAPERRAVREAIEQLGLAPVMFELGARPHPPRDLYRAYLEQSDIFVGLYAERYGWVAPGEEVSGLEDEYLLSAGLPKLIYLREGAEREPRLVDLIDRIRGDDRASYLSFSTPGELAGLVRADLVTLLAERFDLSRTGEQPPADTLADGAPSMLRSPLPVPLTRLIGRERELAMVTGLLGDDDVRLITLTGPGGIGKSRLSVAAAEAVRDRFVDGVVFVDLAPVRDPALVRGAIAESMHVQDSGDGSIDAKLSTALRDRRLLLVLDNFEQVVDAAPQVSALVAAAPELTVLVTSRVLLRVSGERALEVGPLALPGPGDAIDGIRPNPSVDLFVERARAVRPDFELTPSNIDAVERICVALEGVPLAIELAAARIRVLTPAALLERLDRRLAVLAGGARDLPSRQRAIRATIEWSTDLLGGPERELLARLGVFAGGFSLEAAEWLAQGIAGDDVLAALGALVDGSLVQLHDRQGRGRFTMLETVREFALADLTARGSAEAMRERHAQLFMQVGVDAESELEGGHQLDWVARLTDDRENLRTAMRWLLDQRRWDDAASLAWSLFVFWWVAGHLGEVRGWMDEALDSGDELPDRTRAIALYFTRAIAFWQDPDEWLVPGLTESAELFRREGDLSGEALALVSLGLFLLAAREPDPMRADEALETSLRLFRRAGDRWGEAMALITLGRVALMQQRVDDAAARFDESLEIAHRQGDELGQTIARYHSGWARLVRGDLAGAEQRFIDSVTHSDHLGHGEGVAYSLEALVAVAGSRGDIRRAGLMLGASQVLREQWGIYNAPGFAFHQATVEAILAGPGSDAFESARLEGRGLNVDTAVALAIERMTDSASGQPAGALAAQVGGASDVAS
jgi:predicted ATPase